MASPVTPKRTERDTRTDSHRARRRHRETEATAHGWKATCLPLTASIGEQIEAKHGEDPEPWFGW